MLRSRCTDREDDCDRVADGGTGIAPFVAEAAGSDTVTVVACRNERESSVASSHDALRLPSPPIPLMLPLHALPRLAARLPVRLLPRLPGSCAPAVSRAARTSSPTHTSSAVLPRGFRAETSAPALNSAFTAPTLPAFAAACKGAQPRASRALTSAPSLMHCSTSACMSQRSCEAAAAMRCNNVRSPSSRHVSSSGCALA